MAGRVVLSGSQRAEAASAYRSLIRSAKFTFHSDPTTYGQFLARAKHLFVSQVLNPTYLLQPASIEPPSSPPADPQQTETWTQRFQTELRGVHDLARYLTRNIVQAKHADDGKRLVVRMTDKTEIGDNATIKNRGPLPLPTSSGCCGADQPSSSSSSGRLSPAAQERREKRRQNRLALGLSSSSSSSS